MEEISLDHGSTQRSNKNLAVEITDAYKAYTKSVDVLKGFNMNVEEGTIYGLLGPSGCGKTTLLSCIIGRSKLDAGYIKMSVKKKKQIGYMPQDLALYEEFNMLETLHYFGSLYEMSYEDIIDKGEKLLSLMEMPPGKTQFGSMSGGQQRRFSLCAALLHDPNLLILDEPTVGLDPIISTSIWAYLKDLTNRGKTIIITTHYIEEARLANTIGLMRKGVLLAEAPPQEIMDSCNADTLESAFLTLSQKQITEKFKIKPSPPATSSLEKSSFFSPKRFKAQLFKHWYWSVKNWSIILFVCLMPIFVILIFNITIGQIPNPLNFGIINKEDLSHCSYKSFDICDGQIPLSCKYIHEMENKGLILKYYDDIEPAIKDVTDNSIWGYVQIEKNFTGMINTRFDDPTALSSEDIDKSTITSSMDMSNFVVSKLVQGKLLQSYRDLSNAFKGCNKTAVTTVNPISLKMMQPVYGQYEVNVSHYGSAALISILEFYLTFLFTALSISMEKNRGLMERSLSSGLTVSEVMISQLVVQVIILVVQTITVFILQFAIFDYPLLSNLMWPFLLIFLQGLSGTFLGFAASISLDEERITTFLGICIVLTQVFLCGIMWPIEAMHPIMKKISIFFPLTLSVDAFRSMTTKNWGIFHPVIAKGFISIIVWIFIAALISILSLKFKQGIKAKK